MKVFNRIRSFRIERGMTQSDLAYLIGVTKNTISAYEIGTFLPCLVHIFDLIRLFDCSFEDLFYLAKQEEIQI